MRHSWVNLNMVFKFSISSFLKVSLFPHSTLCHKSSARFPKLVRLLSANSPSIFALSLWPLKGTFWSTEFHSIYNGSDSPLVFLMLPWFTQYFLYVLNETFSLLQSLYLWTIVSFNAGFSPLPLEISNFLFSHHKSKNVVRYTS